MIVFYNSIYFSKLIWQKKGFSQILIYFSKPLRLLDGLIIYEIVNFLSSLFTLCYVLLSFFLYLKCVPTHEIVHYNNYYNYCFFITCALYISGARHDAHAYS